MKTLSPVYEDNLILFNDIRSIIDQARNEVATAFNSTLVLANWHIGNRINQEILNNERAGYGEKIIRKPRQISFWKYQCQ